MKGKKRLHLLVELNINLLGKTSTGVSYVSEVKINKCFAGVPTPEQNLGTATS